MSLKWINIIKPVHFFRQARAQSRSYIEHMTRERNTAWRKKTRFYGEVFERQT